jgi:periplasmic divalent cation tolerance protein
VKTAPARLAELIAALGELHPYQVPEILALPAARVSEPYARWVRAETAPE